MRGARVAPPRYREITEGIIMHTIHSMPTSGNGRLSRRVLAGQTTQRGAIERPRGRQRHSG
jgi:hypothetical protein